MSVKVMMSSTAFLEPTDERMTPVMRLGKYSGGVAHNIGSPLKHNRTVSKAFCWMELSETLSRPLSREDLLLGLRSACWR